MTPPRRKQRPSHDDRAAPAPQSDGNMRQESCDRLRLANVVSASCASLIIFVEMLMTDLGLSFGASAIVGGGAIVSWTLFSIGAAGCAYLCVRFLASALAVERELNRIGL